MTDELYDRLRAADPVPGTKPVEPAGSPGTRAMMEAAMSTELPGNESTPVGPDDSRTTTSEAPRGSRLVPVGIAAAAAGVIVAGSLMVPDLFDGDSSTAPTALTLEMADSGGISSSCLPVSADVLRQQDLAFEGTVTALTDDTVALDVDTWFKGAQDAATVELASGPDLVGYSIDFRDGEQYLVSALDGTVSICGLSGEASPELAELYDQAFGG